VRWKVKLIKNITSIFAKFPEPGTWGYRFWTNSYEKGRKKLKGESDGGNNESRDGPLSEGEILKIVAHFISNGDIVISGLPSGDYNIGIDNVFHSCLEECSDNKPDRDNITAKSSSG